MQMERYIVSLKVLDTRFYDGTPAGWERAYEAAQTVFLRDVTDIDAAVEEYRAKLPAGRYEVDDVKWRKVQ